MTETDRLASSHIYLDLPGLMHIAILDLWWSLPYLGLHNALSIGLVLELLPGRKHVCYTAMVYNRASAM
jgi:hypothetical protein